MRSMWDRFRNCCGPERGCAVLSCWKNSSLCSAIGNLRLRCFANWPRNCGPECMPLDSRFVSGMDRGHWPATHLKHSTSTLTGPTPTTMYVWPRVTPTRAEGSNSSGWDALPVASTELTSIPRTHMPFRNYPLSPRGNGRTWIPPLMFVDSAFTVLFSNRAVGSQRDHLRYFTGT